MDPIELSLQHEIICVSRACPDIQHTVGLKQLFKFPGKFKSIHSGPLPMHQPARSGGIGAAFGNGLMVGSRRGTTNKAAISRGGRYLDGNSSSSSSGSSGNGERGAAKRSRGENGVHGQSKLSSRIGRSVGSVGRIDRVIARHGTGVDEEVKEKVFVTDFEGVGGRCECRGVGRV